MGVGGGASKGVCGIKLLVGVRRCGCLSWPVARCPACVHHAPPDRPSGHAAVRCLQPSVGVGGVISRFKCNHA